MGEYDLTFYERETLKQFPGKRKNKYGVVEYELLDQEKNEVVTLSKFKTFQRFKADKKNRSKNAKEFRNGVRNF